MKCYIIEYLHHGGFTYMGDIYSKLDDAIDYVNGSYLGVTKSSHLPKNVIKSYVAYNKNCYLKDGIYFEKNRNDEFDTDDSYDYEADPIHIRIYEKEIL